jgi:predicted transcriptional regulator
MKAVLISIQPKWCELIASGKKTVEVRKTKPKLETPFKCYIYCTSSNVHECLMQNEGGVKLIYACNYKTAIPCGGHIANGKVIGEFVCDEIKEITADNLVAIYFNNPQESTCLNDLEMRRYADGKSLFLWHISDLVIYDKPKELSEFYQKGKSGDKFYYDYCSGCHHHETPVGEYPCNECDGNRNYLYRPPQSWCYVDELR